MRRYSTHQSPRKRSGKKRRRLKNQSQTCASRCDLECFERPRFFGGQLLTDKDLEAAQRYVIEKNKLHNRYLVGTGVVCGLAVRCHPCCDGSVIVESGYAIDCCGNDIVLCQPETVNILDCLEKQREEEEPYCLTRIHARSECQQGEGKDYYLILFYDEEPAHPVTALIRDNGCGNTRCEPSRIRESFRFELVEKKVELVEKKDGKKSENSFKNIGITGEGTKNLLNQLIYLTPDDSFLGQVIEYIPAVLTVNRWITDAGNEEIKDNLDTDTLNTLFYQFRSLLLEFYQREPEIRCNLPDKVAEIENKYQSTDEFEYKYQAAVSMLYLGLQLLIDSFCNAILVPCTECDETQGVILACLTIQGNKIEKICNTVRKQLITGPSLRYWMEPLFSAVEKLLESGCCDEELVKALTTKLKFPFEYVP